jgi:hypothetical protein
VRPDCVIGRIAIIGTIGGELADFSADLAEQRLYLSGVASVRNDLTGVGIDRQMQFAPATMRLCLVFFFQPLARALGFQPGAVNQQVKGPVRFSPSFDQWLPGSCPPAEGGVIRLGSIEDQPHSLASSSLWISSCQYDGGERRCVYTAWQSITMGAIAVA